MRERGRGGNSFDPIVAAGPNGAKPHARPVRPARSSRGELVVIDFGCIVDGYCSDMTRTVCVGEPGRRRPGAWYDVVLASQRAGATRSPPASSAPTVDRGVPRRHRRRGLGRRVRRTAPATASGSRSTRRPGWPRPAVIRWPPVDVVTVEPGVYLPGVGGVRIEDTVVVTAGGCRRRSPTLRRISSSAEHLHQRPEERHGPRPPRGPRHRRRVPARQAGQGWRVRAHQAEERRAPAPCSTARSAPTRRSRSPIIDKREMQYLYREGDELRVHGQRDLRPAPRRRRRRSATRSNYLKEGDTAVLHDVQRTRSSASTSRPRSSSRSPRPSPGMQGDRVSGARKPATLETGLVVQVPLFVEHRRPDQGRHPLRRVPDPGMT